MIDSTKYVVKLAVKLANVASRNWLGISHKYKSSHVHIHIKS